jgi:drug/metabolite transporter (DMT)-like permease
VNARQATLLAVLAAVWGSSYLLIKYALDGFSPAEVVCIRTAVAAVVLWAVLRGQGEPAAKTWNDMKARPWLGLLFGAVGIAAPFLLISYGELEVPSGLTAILIAPAPLLVALLAPLIDHDERIQGSQGIGLVVGIVGVALVVGIEFVDSWVELIAAIGIIGAALCYALAGFIVKGKYTGLPAIGTSAISCSVAAILTLPIAVATAKGHHADAGAIAAAICLGIVQTALALAILYHLIGEIGAGRANLVNYLIPGVALAYGAIFLDEEITAAAIAGLALILVGVSLASRKRADPARDAPPDALAIEEACPPEREVATETIPRRA